MKTEPTPARPPVLMLSALEWRLLLTSVLASTYLVVWLALSRSLPPEAQAIAPPIPRQGTRVERGQGPVWLSDLSLEATGRDPSGRLDACRTSHARSAAGAWCARRRRGRCG